MDKSLTLNNWVAIESKLDLKFMRKLKYHTSIAGMIKYGKRYIWIEIVIDTYWVNIYKSYRVYFFILIYFKWYMWNEKGDTKSD